MRVLRGLFNRGTEAANDQPEPVAVDDPHIVQFLLGPAQLLIAQSRRTRDLWAGSFLLSWLMARAMVAAERAGATIDRPAVDRDPLLNAVRGLRPGDEGPKLKPSLPNEFRATAPNRDIAKAAAKAAETAVHDHWQALAGRVRTEYLDPFLANQDRDQQIRSAAIWDRQIGQGRHSPIFEILHVIGPDDADDADDQRWLARAKLARPLPPDEPESGDLCVLMPDWQELSGHSRVTGASKPHQERFWEAFRTDLAGRLREAQSQDVSLLEIGRTERLSAPALVRRLYPRLPVEDLAEVIGWTPNDHKKGDRRQRWTYMPSTASIAAVHWVERAWAVSEDDCRAFASKIDDVSKALAAAERASPILILRAAGAFGDLDGKLYFEPTLANPREFPASDGPREKIRKCLRNICKAKDADEQEVGQPSGFYGLLRMDGDEMGKRLSTASGRRLSEALSTFSLGVEQQVEAHQGVLIYAGGDDLLAMAPLENVLSLAEALRNDFSTALCQVDPTASMSAAILFTDIQAPLRAALETSHKLLDEVAKTISGRNSLALGVHRIGGTGSVWASPWERPWKGNDVEVAPAIVALLQDERLAAAMANNRFLYGARERLSAFFTTPDVGWAEIVRGDGGGIHEDEKALSALLRATGGEAAANLADDEMMRLVSLLRPCHRKRIDQSGTEATVVEHVQGGLSLDLLVLLRFLRAEGRWDLAS